LAQTCPKCAGSNDDAAVICQGCDFILDTSFLGDDILNSQEGEALDTPQGVDFGMPDTMAGEDLGSSALILGKINPDTGDGNEWASFESEQTGDFLCAPTSHGMRRFEPSTVYIDAETRALLEQDAVLKLKDGVDIDALAMSPFEHHVLALIDGVRPVARIQAKSGLSEEDLRICLTLIADKGVLERVGTARSAKGDDEGAFAEKTVAVLDLPPEALSDGGMPDFLGGPTQATDSLPAHFEGARDDAPNPFERESSPAPVTGVSEEAPFELSPDALTPLPAPRKPAIAASVPPLPGQSGIPPLPGQSGVPPLPGQSGVPPLPGQSKPAAPPPAPETKRARAGSGEQRKAPVIVEKQTRSGGGPAVQEVQRRDPTYLKALNAYESALRDIGQGKLGRAKGLAMMAHNLVPDEPKFAELINEWHRAKEIADASDQAPEHVQAFRRAKEAEAEGDFDLAIEELEKAAKLKPDHAGIQNQLGVLLATQRKDYTRAMGFLFKAVELDKKNTGYRDNLGKVLAMRGNSGMVAPLDGSPAAPGKKVEEKKGGVLGRLLKR
jgi:hypothetical protein